MGEHLKYAGELKVKILMFLTKDLYGFEMKYCDNFPGIVQINVELKLRCLFTYLFLSSIEKLPMKCFFLCVVYFVYKEGTYLKTFLVFFFKIFQYLRGFNFTISNL